MTRTMLLEMLEAERERVKQGFLEDVDLDAYIDKLLEKSEMLVRSQGNRCMGILAFYCNNTCSRKAFISLLLVAPEARRRGIAKDLLENAIRITRLRRFHSVGIEVSPNNRSAHAYYRRFGFKEIGIRDGLISMEIENKLENTGEADLVGLSTHNAVIRVAR